MTASIADEGWDAIVVGTGLGGATLGYALAAGGWRVLFCEKGRARDRESLRGDYAERFVAAAPPARAADVLAAAGRVCDTLIDRSGATPRAFAPFAGAGAGGSSALYGMAMERLRPADFTPRANLSGLPGTTLPERWPISYGDLAPHYAAAESLYRVRGTLDPLRADGTRPDLPPPPPLGPRGEFLASFLARKGMHPYRLPLACDFSPGCRYCQGFLCASDCKVDGFRACVAPAIERHGATLVDRCRVVRLEATRRRVTEVVCERAGEVVRVRGRIVVLASGALATPGLLLASASDAWPAGLANDSGLVGRNLMRHFSDLYAVFLPQLAKDADNRRKELAFNDFCASPAGPLGTVQSFGRLPPADVLAASLRDDLRDARRWYSPLAARLVPAVAPFLGRMVARSSVLATIVEDPPYADNRVTLAPPAAAGAPASLAIDYTIRPADRARIDRQRALMRDLLRPLRHVSIRQAENAHLLAHACGTCRFGDDPQASVLDAGNRAHGLENLYVVDASFMPSSGGTNPGLTIAANALRVAARLLGRRVPVGEPTHDAA